MGLNLGGGGGLWGSFPQAPVENIRIMMLKNSARSPEISELKKDIRFPRKTRGIVFHFNLFSLTGTCIHVKK